MPTKAIKQKLQEKYTKWAILILIMFGILGITGRLLLANKTILHESDVVWTISIEAQITEAEKGDRVSISPPWNSPHIHVVSQKLQHTGMRVIRIKSDIIPKRSITLQTTNPGDFSIQAEFDVHISATQASDFTPIIKPLTADDLALYLGSEEKIDLASHDIKSTLAKVTEGITDNDELIRRIFRYTKNSIIKDNTDKRNDAEIALRNNRASTLGRARAMIGLCRAAGIPARIVSGLILEDAFEASPHYWVEVYTGNIWKAYDPEKGYAEKLPGNFVAFSLGNSHIVRSKRMDNLQVAYSIEQNYDLVGLNIPTKKQFRDIFNLNRFPPDTRNNLGLLLLLPLGVLITALCRNLLGIRAYGTFTPTLLALAAVYADWAVAIVLLAIVVALGLTGRSAMPDKLARVPRLAIMFTIVIMSMILGISLMEYFRINSSEHVILLPIVILTTLIDRFYSTADDNGIYIAIRRMVWTIIIGLLCYPLLKLESLGSLLLAFPETHFITLAIILMVSIYKDKQLSDFPAFGWIKEPKSRKKENESGDESAL